MTATPFTPIPSWLDPTTEAKGLRQPDVFENLNNQQKAITGIAFSFKYLLQLDPYMTPEEASEVIANSISETGHFKPWSYLNFRGWKINKTAVEQAKKVNGGVCPRWWQAPGHILSGDEPVVYYRVFDTPGQFYSEWLQRFVPKGSNVSPTHRYYQTGRDFWDTNPDIDRSLWFRDLIRAGYKGPVTQANPEASIATFKILIKSTKNKMVQFCLGLDPDGDIGPKTLKAINLYKKETNITDDTAMLESLVDRWKAQGSKVPYVKI